MDGLTKVQQWGGMVNRHGLGFGGKSDVAGFPPRQSEHNRAVSKLHIRIGKDTSDNSVAI